MANTKTNKKELQGIKNTRPNGSYSYALNGIILACIKEGKKHTVVYLPKRMGQDLAKLQSDFGKTLGQYVVENPSHIKNPKDAFFAKMEVPTSVKVETILAKLEVLGNKLPAKTEKKSEPKAKSEAPAKKSEPSKSKAKTPTGDSPKKSILPKPSFASDTKAIVESIKNPAPVKAEPAK